MQLSLTKLPWYAQVGAFVALAVGGCGIFFYYYEMPVRADFQSRQQQLVGLRADITKGLTTAKKLPEFRAQVGELEARLENLRAVLPEEKDAADLLNRMQTVASQSSLTIKGFKPGATVTKQLHAEWPISLEDRQTGNVTISATCTATTFVLLDKPAPAKAGAKPAAAPAPAAKGA